MDERPPGDAAPTDVDDEGRPGLNDQAAPASAPRASGDGASDEARLTMTGSATETPTTADAAAMGRLVDEILPLLIARFRAGRMGELEVRRAEWHVRLRRPLGEPAGSAEGIATHGADTGRRLSRGAASQPSGPAASAHPPGGASFAAGLAPVGPGRPGDGQGPATSVARSLVATSPGVGYYATRDGIATGSQVRTGDVLGHVDVLGVRQEVVAPGDGIVARLLADGGEAVEYGQDLVRLEPVTRADPVREA